MSVQQPGVRRPEDETDSFPDPKRSWGRSGSLLATWAVLLTAIYFAGWVFDGLVDKTAESNLDKPVEDANQTARRVLQFSLVHRTPEKADELLCEGFSGVSPSKLTNQLTDWEAENDVLAEATVTFDNVNGEPVSGGTLFPMLVELEVDPSFIKWNFDVTVLTDGDSFCVSSIKDVTSEN